MNEVLSKYAKAKNEIQEAETLLKHANSRYENLIKPQRLPSDYVVLDISAMSQEQKISIIYPLLGCLSWNDWEEIKREIDLMFKELRLPKINTKERTDNGKR